MHGQTYPSVRALRLSCALFCILAAMAVIAPGWARTPCPEAEGCRVEGGRYHAFVPDGGPPRRLLLFFHGFGGSGRGELENAAFRQWAEQERTILILPDGRDGRWSVTTGLAGGRDDIGFVQAVLADARERLTLSADAPLVLAGFSLGASMVWTLACAGQPNVAGYVAFSGAFWEPAPERCASTTAPMVHFHGLNDVTVPVMGREVRSGRRQAPIAKAFAAIAVARACRQPPAWEAVSATPAGLECAGLAECRGPGAVLYCTHGEGHSLRLEWLSFALARLDAATGGPSKGR